MIVKSYTAGVDLGSAATKAAILDGTKLVGWATLPTRATTEVGIKALNLACEQAKIRQQDIQSTVATGYGRINAKFANKVVTEITCHGCAAKYLDKKVEAVIDIGGQDSKAMLLNAKGEIEDFVMNDKCAAGTGRFIELIAMSLGLKIEQVGDLSLKAKKPANISSMCAVFAESEVVTLIAEGVLHADILAGVHQATARRIVAMAGRINIKNKVIAISGGGAINKGLLKALENELKQKVVVPQQPQLVGAIGAALIAQRSIDTNKQVIPSVFGP